MPFTRKLRVRHAVGDFGAQAGGAGTLEGLVRQVLGQPAIVRQATFNGKNVYLLHEALTQEGVYLHVVLYTAGDSVTAIGDPRVAVPQGLAPVPPPANSQFVDATLLYLISDNDVFCCRSGVNTDSPMIAWVWQAARQAGIPAADYQFGLKDRANIDKLMSLRRDGVKSLTFNAAASEAAVANAQRDSARKSILGAVWDQAQSLAGQGVGAQPIASAMKVEVKLSVEQRRAAVVVDPLILAVASQAVEDEDPGFRIVTGQNKVITAEDVVLSKSVILNPLGKHPDHAHGWQRLGEFKDELTRPQP